MLKHRFNSRMSNAVILPVLLCYVSAVLSAYRTQTTDIAMSVVRLILPQPNHVFAFRQAWSLM